MKNQVFPPKSPRKCAYNRASGNVLILILIVTALFGALSFAMMQGNRANTGLMGGEQAKLAASRILENAQVMKNAYKTLLINGCAQANISWANHLYVDATYYPDPVTAPVNKTCHIYEGAGGKVKYEDFSDIRLVNPPFNGFSYASIVVEGVGSPASDVVIAMNALSKDVCMAINQQINGTAEVYAGNGGGMINSGDNQTAATCPKCVGKPIACIISTTNNMIYYVLQAN